MFEYLCEWIWRFPVNIPDGSVIKHIVINYENFTDSTPTTVWLTRYGTDGNHADLASATSRGDAVTGAGFFSDASDDLAGATSIVDNQNFGYMFVWSGTGGVSTQRLCSAQVAYYAPSIFGMSLPLVTK